MIHPKEMAELVKARCEADDERDKVFALLLAAGWEADGPNLVSKSFGCKRGSVSAITTANGRLQVVFPIGRNQQSIYFDTAEEMIKYVDEVEQHLDALH